MPTKPKPTPAPAAPADALPSLVPATAPALVLPALGSRVQVRVADGVLLLNTETGQPFGADQVVPQTVTLTTRRRLLDGDLQLA